LAFQPFQN